VTAPSVPRSQEDAVQRQGLVFSSVTCFGARAAWHRQLTGLMGIRIRARVMSRHLRRSVLTAISQFLRDGCGASATMVTIALPVLIGFGTLGAETGLWYTIRRQNQSAADAAAISAAYEVIAGETNLTADLTPTASEAATQNGYTGSPPLVVHPYSDTIVNNGVAVTLQQTQPGLLASLFLPSVTIATKAVAVIKVLDHSCILALATIGTGIEVGASSSLDVPNCSVAANSTSSNSIDIQSSTGSITAATLVTRGEVSLGGTPIDPAAPPSEFVLTSRPLIGAPGIANPYASRLTDAFLTSGIPPIPAVTNSWAGVTTTIIAGRYDGGMSFGAAAVVDLMPGVYYVTDGNFTVTSSATVTCTTCSGADGVTIILTTTQVTGGIIGNLQISPGATVTLQAPNSGTFSGLLFIQDPMATSAGGANPDNAFNGGPGMNLTGLLYFPSTTVAFEGNPNARCTVLIANQVAIAGNPSFTTSGCKAAGLSRLPTVHTVALAE